MNYSFIARQPNGLLCRYSSVVECVTNINMTEEDYIEMCAERGREMAREIIASRLADYNRVIDETTTLNMTEERFLEIRKLMENPAFKNDKNIEV